MHYKQSFQFSKLISRSLHMKKFLNHPFVKILLTSGIPIAITVIVAIIQWYNLIFDRTFYIKISILIILVIIYLIASIYYYISDQKNIKKIQTFDDLESSKNFLDERLQHGVSSMPSIIDGIITTSSLNLNIWGFELECQEICKKIYDFFKVKLKSESKDISVSCTDKTDHNNYKMIAIKATDGIKLPERYRKNVLYKVAGNYYYIKSFNQRETIILSKKEQILQNFLFKDPSYPCNYRQYISIPVYDVNKNVTTRIEIVAYNNTIIEKDTQSINELVNYIMPLINWLAFVKQVQLALSTETPSAA